MLAKFNVYSFLRVVCSLLFYLKKIQQMKTFRHKWKFADYRYQSLMSRILPLIQTAYTRIRRRCIAQEKAVAH